MNGIVDKRNPIPRYLQVRAILEESIREGRYQPGGRLPGERELAADLQVSQMTVNKAIAALVQDGWLRREAGNGTFVHEDLQVPAPPSVTIGFAIPFNASLAEEDFYLGSLLRGIQRAAVNEPVKLKVLEAPKDSLYDKIVASDVEAFILIDVLDKALPDIERLARDGRKMLILGADRDPLNVPYVDSDNAEGTRHAVEQLLLEGHRRIAGAFAYMEKCNSRQRHQAFCSTLQSHRIPVDSELLFDLGSGEPLCGKVRARMLAHLQRPDRPTAILCGGFLVAVEVMQLLKEAKLRVPEDVSVIGFDDPLAARYLTPPLTTVRQPLEEMGERAMKHLMRWLRTGQAPPMRTVLPETLVMRSSTSAPI